LSLCGISKRFARPRLAHGRRNTAPLTPHDDHIMPRKEGGRWAEVKADATIAWPLIVKAVMEWLDG
jgi:hypothetical protein